METAAASRHDHHDSKHTGRPHRRSGRLALAGAILVGSIAIAGTAGASGSMSREDSGDTQQGQAGVPLRQPGDMVPQYQQPRLRDDVDLAGRLDPDVPEADDTPLEEPVEEPQYDEDYGDDYPNGCGEDELVACPQDDPGDDRTCEDYEIYAAGICGDDTPGHDVPGQETPGQTDYGTTTTVVTDTTEPGYATTTTMPLEEVAAEVKGQTSEGTSLAYTGSSSKLPLVGAGLLAAGGLAAGLSTLARRNTPDGA